MNHSNDSFPRNQYAREPSSASPDSQMEEACNDNGQQQQPHITPSPTSYGGRRPPRNTLKDRIKRNMLSDSFTSATRTTSTHHQGDGNGGGNNNNDTAREESILAAASALASLGVTTSPAVSSSGHVSLSGLSSGQGTMSVGRERGMSHTSVASTSHHHHTPGSYRAANNAALSLSSQQQRHRDNDNLFALVRPPPSLDSIPVPSQSIISSRAAVVAEVAAPREVAISRPIPGLLGSDIPLTFPQKLMEVLSSPQIADIITWLPHGKGFMILQKRKFALDVMPLYFKHSKFTSFTRKLNRWGFSRVSRGPEMGAYYQKFFQRGNYLLCMQMHCRSTNTKPSSSSAAKDKKIGVDAISSPNITSQKAPSVNASASSHAKSSSPSLSYLQLDDQDDSNTRTYPMSPLSRDLQSPLSRDLQSPHTKDRVFLTNNTDLSATRQAASCISNSASSRGMVAGGGLEGNASFADFVQHQQNYNSASGTFNQAFNRQQQILQQQEILHRQSVHQDQQRQQQQVQTPSAFQMVKDNVEMNQYRGGIGGSSSAFRMVSNANGPVQRGSFGLMPNVSQGQGSYLMLSRMSQPPLKSSMKKPHQLLSSILQQNQPQAIATPESNNGSTHPNHPHLVVNAMNALKSRNNHSLLQNRFHAAMQAQLRQLEELSAEQYSKQIQLATSTLEPQGSIYQGRNDGVDSRSQCSSNVVGSSNSFQNTSSMPTPHVQDAVHAAMLAQMRQLDKSNRERLAGMGRQPQVKMAPGIKPLGSIGNNSSSNKPVSIMTQKNVARIYNDLNTRQQERHIDSDVVLSVPPSSNKQQQQPQQQLQQQMQYPWAVRRASAA